jgi:RNA polymerase sigma factor (sigma-70 family)
MFDPPRSTADLDDAALLARACVDDTAFEALYRRYVRRVTAFAVHHCRSPDDVADVVSDTFLSLIEHGERYDPRRGSVSSFVHSIARSKVRDQHRRTWRRVRLASRVQGRRLLSPDDIARLEEALDAADRLRGLRVPLGDLSDREQQILRLVATGHSPSEAAHELGISPEAARARLARLRRKLPPSPSATPCPTTPHRSTPSEEDPRHASHA